MHYFIPLKCLAEPIRMRIRPFLDTCTEMNQEKNIKGQGRGYLAYECKSFFRAREWNKNWQDHWENVNQTELEWSFLREYVRRAKG